MQGQEAFSDKDLVTKLLDLLNHPDHDVQERALLALISLAAQPGPRAAIQAQGGRRAAREAEVNCRELLQDADQDHRHILEHLIVLQTDLGEVLVEMDEPVNDRSEL